MQSLLFLLLGSITASCIVIAVHAVLISRSLSRLEYERPKFMHSLLVALRHMEVTGND